MRTRNDADEITPLPPPPAPTARDANPWPVTDAPAAPRRQPPPRVARRLEPGTRKARNGLRNVLVIGIVAFVVLSGVLEALQGSGPEALIGVVFPLLIMGILFLARRQKSRRRDRATPADGGD